MVIEPLENRQLLTTSIDDFHLVADTGSSPSDLVTSDPRVTGIVQADTYVGYVEVQFDQSGDGGVDGYTYVYSSGSQFTYDPRSYDYSLSSYTGSFTLNYRTVEYDEFYNPVVGAWHSFTFTLEIPAAPELTVRHTDGYGYEQELYDGYSSLYLDGTTIGSPVDKTFTIQNTGTGALTLDPNSISRPLGFTLLTPPAASVAAGAATTFTVRLDAASSGQFSGQLSFPSNDADENPFEFWLSGEVSTLQPEVAVQYTDAYGYPQEFYGTSGNVSFGTTPLRSPISTTFSIFNTGSGVLMLDSLAVSAGFTVTTPFAAAVQPGDSSQLTVQLDATSSGPLFGTLSFSSNDADESSFVVTLQGEVTAGGGEPEITVTEPFGMPLVDGFGSFSFGTTAVGTAVSRTFVVRNDGASPLTLDAASLQLPPGFTLVTPFDSPITAGAATTFTVRLEAAFAGEYQGTLSFTNGDGDENPFEFQVYGTVTQPEPEISVRFQNASGYEQDIYDGNYTIYFPNATAGQSVAQTFTIHNTGTGPLTLDTASLSLPQGFSLVSSFASEVGVGGSTTFAVLLNAETGGQFQGNLSFASGDANENPFDFFLYGTVTAPEPEIAVRYTDAYGYEQELYDGYSSLSLGNTSAGAPISRTFTICNTGQADLSLDPVTLSLPSGFSLVTPFASPVAAGDSTTFTVQLDAEAGGQFQGSLSFASGDANENPFDFFLYGTVTAPEPEIAVRYTDAYGYEHELSDGYSSLSFGNTLAGVPVSRTFTIYNTGQADLSLDPVSLPPGFSLMSSFASDVAPGDSTSFAVQFDAGTGGPYQGTLSFGSNDADESPFNWTISGTVVAATPIVSVDSTRDAAEGGQAGFVRLVRTGDTSQELTVVFTVDTMGSQATPGTDFLYLSGTSATNPLSGSITFGLGASYADISVVASSDGMAEGDESLRIVLTSATGYGLGLPSGVTIALADAQVIPIGPLADEVQSIVLPDAAGGAWTIALGSEVTESLSHDGSALTVQAALEALAAVGAGNVTVSGAGRVASPFTITFGGQLAGRNVELLSVDSGGLTGGPAVVATVTEGGSLSGEPASATLQDAPGELSLLHDTGPSATDRITADPCLMGVVRMSGGPWRDVQVEFDTNEDGLPDGALPISNPSEAWFAYTGPGLPYGELTISSRVKAVLDSGAPSEPAQVGPWTSFAFTFTTVHGAALAPNVGDLRLVRDTGPSSSDRVTSDPALTGTLSAAAPVAFYAMEFDLDGDGVRDAESLADSQGRYVYVPSGLSEGPVTVFARARGWDYDEQAGVRAPWAPFTFELESPHLDAPTVVALELRSDSGPSTNDAQTANGLLVGQVHGAQTAAGITVYFDHDGDDVPDGAAFSDARGRFVYQPTALPLGNVTVRARASQWDFDQGHYVDGAWAEISFEYQVQPNLAPKLVTTAVNDGGCLPWDVVEFEMGEGGSGTGDIEPAGGAPACVLSAPWVTTPHLVGRIVDDGPLWDAVIEVDYTGDLIADVETTTNELGEFSYRLPGLEFGERIISTRTRQLDHAAGPFLFGEWQTLSFQFPAPAAETSPPPASPALLPTVRIVDLHVSPLGSLDVSGAVAVADTLEGRIGADPPVSAGTSPPVPFDAGLWISAHAADIFVQLDVGGDGSVEAELPVDAAGNFAYALPSGPDGLATVRVRVQAPTGLPEYPSQPLPDFLTTDPWAASRFVRAADPADPAMGQLAAALGAADPNWRHWRLETDTPELTAAGVYEREQQAAQDEYDQRVEQAAAARKSATADATRLYDLAVKGGDETYHAAVVVANSQLEADLAAFAGDAASHPWRDSVWPAPPPTDGLRIPDDRDQPLPPRAPTYDGPQYNFTADKVYQAAIETADDHQQAAKQAIEQAYRDAEQAAKNAFGVAEREAQTRHTQAINAARSQYAAELRVEHPTINVAAEHNILAGHATAANQAYDEALSVAYQGFTDAVQAAIELRDETLRIASEDYADRLAQAAAAATEAERRPILADAERLWLIAQAEAAYAFEVARAHQQRLLDEALAQAALDRDFYWTAGDPVTPGLSWEDHFLAWWYAERDRKIAEHDHWINAYRIDADWTRANDEALADRTLAGDLAAAAQIQRDAVAQAAHDRDRALAQAETVLWQAKADAAMQALDRWDAHEQTPWTAYQKALTQHQVDYVSDLNTRYLTFRQDAIAATRTKAIAVSAAIRDKESSQGQTRFGEAVDRAGVLRGLRLGANDADRTRAISVAGGLKLHRAEFAEAEAQLVWDLAVINEMQTVGLAAARRDYQIDQANAASASILAAGPVPDPVYAAALAQAQYDYNVSVAHVQRTFRDAGIEARLQASEARSTSRIVVQRGVLDHELTYRDTLATLFLTFDRAVAGARAASSLAIVAAAGALDVAASAAETDWWSTVAGAQRTYDSQRAGLIRTADLADSAVWRLFQLQRAADYVLSVSQWATDAFPAIGSIACSPPPASGASEMTLTLLISCGPPPTVAGTAPWSKYQYDLAVAGFDYVSDWTAGAAREVGDLADAAAGYVNSTSTAVESYANDVAGAHETYVQDLVDGLTRHAQTLADAVSDRDVQAATATADHDRAVALANRDFHDYVQSESAWLPHSRDYSDAERDREISEAVEEMNLAGAAALRTLALALIACSDQAAGQAARAQYDESMHQADEQYQERIRTAWEWNIAERDALGDWLEHRKADTARDVIYARTSQDATLTQKLAEYDSQLAEDMRTASDDLADARGAAAVAYSTASAEAAKDRVDGYADADQVYAVADTQAGAAYYAATDAADSDHREQTADDRGEYEVAMFGRHAGQMNVALSDVLALPAPSPIQELLLTYRSGTAVHDVSLAGAVRAARNDYQTLLTPAYAAATAADGLADVAFTSSASGADRTYNVSMSDVGRQWWVGFDGAVIARQVAAQKADAARARSQAAAEAAYTTQRAWAGADLQQRYADAYVQWTDAVSAAQDVLQQPGVGPADGQYLGYLTSMAHQARETEIRLAQEAYVAAIAGGQTTRADDLGTAEDVLATGLNAAGSAYTSAVNSAESGFTGGAGAAGVSHVQGLVNADAVYANSLAGSSRNLTGQLGNADVFLTHALGSADAGYRNATAQREAAYQVGLAQRQEVVLASWSHPDALFEHARASAERVFLQGTQTAYTTFALDQAQADADRDTAWAQARSDHQVRQADADILHTTQLGINDVGHTVGVAASHQDVFDDLTTLVNARRSQLFTPYALAAVAEAADGHNYAVDLADAEGDYQTAVAAARRAYQQAAAPIENQFAFAVYQAEYNYQAALTAQDPNAWTQYQAALQAAGDTRNAAIQPLVAAQQAAVTQAERDRTAALADGEHDRAGRLADREQTFTQGYGVANRDYLSGLAVALHDLDYDVASSDESYQNGVAVWDAQLERDYAQSETLLWSAEQDAENAWSAAAGQGQADLWRAEYLGQTAAAAELDNQLNSPWSDVQLDLASAKQTWWNANEPAYLDWIDLTSAADTAYQQQVNVAYLVRANGWAASDVDYAHDVAAAARQSIEDRSDEQYDYLTDQAGRSYTYVDQYANSRHEARVAWAAADRWSRIGQDDAGASYDYERYMSDSQAAQDAFQAATDATRREYRIPRATGEAHRQIRSAEIDLQYVEDVAAGYVDWTADVELYRRLFSEWEATAARGRTGAVAAADDSYWRQEAGTFAADLSLAYPPPSGGIVGPPWGRYAAVQETAEAGWVTTTSTGRNVWEGTVADARKTERFELADALQTRNNRLAAGWADREITAAEGRLQTARTSAYDDVLATLAGTLKPLLPRLPGCSTATTGDTTSGSTEDSACLPGLSPVNLDAVPAGDYTVPDQITPPWDGLGGTGVLSWAPPVQLADNQVHPVTPPLPGVWFFPGSPLSPIDLSASLASSEFPDYYNNVIDQIFGKSDFDRNVRLSGFRALGTGVDAVFSAYGSPASEATEHLLDGAGGSDGTGGQSSGTESPGGTYGATGESGDTMADHWSIALAPETGRAIGGGYAYHGASYSGEGTADGSYANPYGTSSDPSGPPGADGGGTTDGLSDGGLNPSPTTIVLPPNHPLVRPQTQQSDDAIRDAVRETEHKEWREILGGAEGPLTPEQEEEFARRMAEFVKQNVIVIVLVQTSPGSNAGTGVSVGSTLPPNPNVRDSQHIQWLKSELERAKSEHRWGEVQMYQEALYLAQGLDPFDKINKLRDKMLEEQMENPNLATSLAGAPWKTLTYALEKPQEWVAWGLTLGGGNEDLLQMVLEMQRIGDPNRYWSAYELMNGPGSADIYDPAKDPNRIIQGPLVRIATDPWLWLSARGFSRPLSGPSTMNLIPDGKLTYEQLLRTRVLYHYAPAEMIRIIEGAERKVGPGSIAREGLIPGLNSKLWATSMPPEAFAAWRVGGSLGADILARYRSLRFFRKNFSQGVVVIILDSSSFGSASGYNPLTFWKTLVGQYSSTLGVPPENIVVVPLSHFR